MSINWRNYITGSADLITVPVQTREGFLELAEVKFQKASSFIAEALEFSTTISKIENVGDLLQNEAISSQLLAASGFSDKAVMHITPEDKERVIAAFVRKLGDDPNKERIATELIFRFLLTRGETLGGKMRNIGGQIAKDKLLQKIISVISDNDSINLKEHDSILAWENKLGERTCIFDKKVPQSGSNVDIVLLNCMPVDIGTALQNDEKYIALGELKGGVDPAGADEHWKTAVAALTRIREGFENSSSPPKTFFIGAAIEQRMANEIFRMLAEENLDFAANITVDNQFSELCKWLVNL